MLELPAGEKQAGECQQEASNGKEVSEGNLVLPGQSEPNRLLIRLGCEKNAVCDLTE